MTEARTKRRRRPKTRQALTDDRALLESNERAGVPAAAGAEFKRQSDHLAERIRPIHWQFAHP